MFNFVSLLKYKRQMMGNKLCKHAQRSAKSWKYLSLKLNAWFSIERRFNIKIMLTFFNFKLSSIIWQNVLFEWTVDFFSSIQ